MFQIVSRRALAIFATVAFAFAFAGGAPADAAKAKSTSNEAKWVQYDEGTSTVTVKILKKGKGPNKKLVKKGKEVTFNVIPTGSVLKRTSVAINGVKGELTDIQPGKKVLIYWVPDPNKDGELFARKIDGVFSEEELDKRYKSENVGN